MFGNDKNRHQLSEVGESIPALHCDISLPRFAELVIVGHKLILVVVDLQRFDLA